MKRDRRVYLLVVVNPYLATAILYLTLGALALIEVILSYVGIVVPVPGLAWLRVHMIVLGGITQIIFGTLPSFLAARIGTPAPTRATNWRLWGLLNTAILLVMAGMVGERAHIFAAGVTVALVGVAYFLKIIWDLGSLATGEQRLMARFYAVGIFYLFLGVLASLTIVTGWPRAPGGPAGAREAHVHANIWGFLNIVLGFSLFDLMPKIFGHSMDFPNVSSRTWWGLAIANLLLVLAPWMGGGPLLGLGLSSFLYFMSIIYSNVWATVSKSPNRVAALQLAASYFWLILPAIMVPAASLLGPGILPLSGVQLVGKQSLVAGFALQLAMVAVPSVIHRLPAGQLPVPCNHEQRPHILRWISALFANLGPVLFWVASLALPRDLFAPVMATGYVLILLAWIPFLARIWRVLAKSSRPETADAADACGTRGQ